jgi:hypothetical protein
MFLNCQRADSSGRRAMEGRRVGAEPSSNTRQDNTAKACCMPGLYFGWLLTRSPPSACAARDRCDVWRGTPRGRPKRHAQTIHH